MITTGSNNVLLEQLQQEQLEKKMYEVAG